MTSSLITLSETAVKQPTTPPMKSPVLPYVMEFLKTPSDSVQMMHIEVAEKNKFELFVTKMTQDEAKQVIDNPRFDRLCDKRDEYVQTRRACSAARRFMLEHGLAHNPFTPQLRKNSMAQSFENEHLHPTIRTVASTLNCRSMPTLSCDERISQPLYTARSSASTVNTDRSTSLLHPQESFAKGKKYIMKKFLSQ